MSHYVYRNWQAAEFSKLHLYVIYIWLIVFILTSFILQLGSYLTLPYLRGGQALTFAQR